MESIKAKLVKAKSKADAWIIEKKASLTNTYQNGLMGKWSNDLNDLPKFILSFSIGIGVALVVLGSFVTGLGSTASGNTVSNIIGYFNQALVSFGYLVVLLIFVAAIYSILHEKKIV